MTSYPMYGGPLAGSLSDDSATIYTYKDGIMAALQSIPGEGENALPFFYGLIEQHGHNVFVPVTDGDLVRSYESIRSGPTSLEADALRMEINRRGIAL